MMRLCIQLHAVMRHRDTLKWTWMALHHSGWDVCVQINEHLQTRVYMVGNEVTLADLVLLGAVHEAVVSMRPRLHSYCNPAI